MLLVVARPAFTRLTTLACTCKPPLSQVLTGTGLQFSADAAVVRSAIATLKQRQPNTRVLLAVGGATYTAFNALNTQCIKDLVDDFGEEGCGGELGGSWEKAGSSATPPTSPLLWGMHAPCLPWPLTLLLLLPPGFDGVDLDYEPSSPDCTVVSGVVKCATDAEIAQVTTALRTALPKGKYLLSTASW